jgi:peptidoglycan hydrolase-like protein with peptidoglycan-binding domain
MSSERATEIQTALIKAGYLSGTPSGTWDASSQAAMEKLQADNGWQTKIVPDSRAIIKLGLGPSASASTSPVANADASHNANQ